MKQGRQMARSFVVFDTAYIRWRAEFARFEPNCFDAVCDFVRAHFDNLIDRFYGEGYEALKEFPAWAFERYVREGTP